MSKGNGNPKPTEGEQSVLEGLEDGSLTPGDLLNACKHVVGLGIAEARKLGCGDITRASKRMRKRWQQFEQSWNNLLAMCREFDGGEGIDEYEPPEPGPDDEVMS